MENKRNIIGLFILFFAIMSYAQENKKSIPLDRAPKTYTFTLPELQVDSSFITNLSTALFGASEIDNRSEWKHFHLTFEAIDSLNYSIHLTLCNIPARESIGFFQHNKFFYWLGGELPPHIILKKKTEKRFSYKEPIPGPYNNPLWTLTYCSETGKIKTESIEIKVQKEK